PRHDGRSRSSRRAPADPAAQGSARALVVALARRSGARRVADRRVGLVDRRLVHARTRAGVRAQPHDSPSGDDGRLAGAAWGRVAGSIRLRAIDARARTVMCTVSVVASRGGVRLVCNRDERVSRPVAQPPALHRTAAGVAIYPVDPESGGTWVGVTDRGFAAVLINRTVARWDHRPSPATTPPPILP